jgi:hypothetical protein
MRAPQHYQEVLILHNIAPCASCRCSPNAVASPIWNGPFGQRPQHETLEGIMDWLAGPAQQVGVPSLIGEFDEFAWRMLAAGFPLLACLIVAPRQGYDEPGFPS